MFWNSFCKILTSLLLASSLTAAGSVAGYPMESYTNIYVFGDSFSDSGNGGRTRYTNDMTYAEYLARRPGILGSDAYPYRPSPDQPADPDGTNFALIGAQATGVINQVNTFRISVDKDAPDLNLDDNADADRDALYVVWAGINDVRIATTSYMKYKVDANGNPVLDANGNPVLEADYEKGFTKITEALEGVDTGLKSAISGLYTEGARHFLVMNVPNLANFPSFNVTSNSSPERVEFYSRASIYTQYYNSELRGAIRDLGNEKSGININTLNTYGLLDDVIARPQNYKNPNGYNLSSSFNRTTDCPSVTGRECDDPGSYLFWDQLHLTETGHRIIADAAYHAVIVPEPETYAMLLAGLGLLGFTARRRKGGSRQAA
jgi:phospholipase/lecithinase/hemolysin